MTNSAFIAYFVSFGLFGIVTWLLFFFKFELKQKPPSPQKEPDSDLAQDLLSNCSNKSYDEYETEILD
jgi:hypothetical protein